MSATLIRVDKNGSKYYEGIRKCDRCGGSGSMPYYAYDGVCLKCGGAGKVFEQWIERTPEYEAVLAEKRAERASVREAQREAQLKADFVANKQKNLAHNGFNENGVSWLFLGDTYSRKDEIKALGGKFDYDLGWHIDHEVEGFNLVSINADDYFQYNEYAMMSLKDGVSADTFNALKRAENLKYEKASEYVGTVGDKVNNITVTLVRKSCWDSQFGVQYFYSFKDEDSNIYTWKTSKDLGDCLKGDWRPIENGEQMVICGTIKDHSEYRGDKQTVLTRCKVVINE